MPKSVGTITVREGKRGNTYRAQMPEYLDPVTDQKVRPGETFKTLEEAEEYLRIQNIRRLGGTVDTIATVRDIVAIYLGREGMKPTSRRAVRDSLAHVTANILNAAVVTVRADQMEQWTGTVLAPKAGLGLNTKEQVMKNLSAVFEYAIQMGIPLQGNPVKAIKWSNILRDKAPAIEAPDWDAIEQADEHPHFGRGPIWSAEQIRHFLIHSPYPYKAAMILYALQTFRRGEVLGIKRPFINPQRRLVVIGTNITRGETNVILPSTKGGLVGWRAELDDMSAQAVTEHLALLDTEKEAYETWDEADWVFTRRKWYHKEVAEPWHPGQHMMPSTLTSRVNDASKRYGFPRIGPHGLRRSWITLAAKLGVPEEVRRDIAGHSAKSMTDRYNRTDEGRRREALSLVRQAIFPDWKAGDPVP